MGKRIVRFAGKSIAIAFDHADAEQLINFLFCDLEKTESVTPAITLQIHMENRGKQVSLYNGVHQLHQGNSLHALADALINETIYQFIRKNKKGHMLHAAALSCNGKGILIPGQSGSGKSTLSAWLTYHGLNYLTDELVLISNDPYRIHPFTRPVCLKASAVSPLTKLAKIDRKNQILDGAAGCMIPHRLLNSNHIDHTPNPIIILFPTYDTDKKTTLTKLSGAQSGLKLMACHVNARNLKGHGFRAMAEMARMTEAFSLTYNGFGELSEVLQPIFGKLRQNNTP